MLLRSKHTTSATEPNGCISNGHLELLAILGIGVPTIVMSFGVCGDPSEDGVGGG
jgi:hypothetical protein